jgi:hypothetical protein
MLQVLEIRPSIMWDKGKALEFLLESLGTARYDKQIPSPYFLFFLDDILYPRPCHHNRFHPSFYSVLAYHTTCPKQIA